jgi:O-antigen/teichoic acid export membrane protein
MYKYGLWVILGGAASALLPHIEKVLLPGFEGGLSSTAIFDIASRIAVIIAIPKNSIVLISAPILSAALHNNEVKEVESIYKKSSLNLYIIGSLLLLGIWCNVDSVFQLIPNSDIYSSGKWVVLMIGLAKLTDMMTGLNSEILTNSKYFRYDLVFVFLLTALLALTNIYLIPLYGYNGAAAASFISMLIYNLTKLLFIYNKMHIQPFSWKTLQVTLLILVTYGVVSCIPSLFSATLFGVISDVLLRSITIVLIFGGGILYWKISDEISAGIQLALQVLQKKTNR